MIVAVLGLMPLAGGAQPLLEFRTDLAFHAGTVDEVAERGYRERLKSLAAAGRLDTDTALLDRLNRLLASLVAAARYELPAAADIAWEIHSCSRCGENAAAMAGGKLLVGEEFIAEMALGDDELAYLLAHEMAHVLAQHTRELATIARYIVDHGRYRQYEDIQRELDESIAVNLRMSVLYGQQEIEADYIGHILGARSGYRPEAMLSMLRKVLREEGDTFMRHPDRNSRMQRAQSMLPIARRLNQIGIPVRP
jgi:predicted Zn-dependent protease